MSVYLERMPDLPQGTPLFQRPDGHKECPLVNKKGKASCVVRAVTLNNYFLVCPGCDKLCQIARTTGLTPGDPFVVERRPKRTKRKTTKKERK
jgi:hypothetical protein